jgi:hypothetical protein
VIRLHLKADFDSLPPRPVHLRSFFLCSGRSTWLDSIVLALKQPQKPPRGDFFLFNGVPFFERCIAFWKAFFVDLRLCCDSSSLSRSAVVIIIPSLPT